MALIGNYSVLSKHPGLSMAGESVLGLSKNRDNFNKTSGMRNFYMQDGYSTEICDKTAFPNGYIPPYTWVLPQKSGGMASYTIIIGSGAITFSNLAGGINISSGSNISGSGTITDAGLGLIVSGVAMLSGSGVLTADIVGTLEAVSILVGSGSFTAALGAIADCMALVYGSGSISGTSIATGWVSADITPFTATSPEAIAAKVWQSIAADFNTAGTMGAKMNAASAAGDPWTAELPGSYPEGSAGFIIYLITQILKNKMITDPSTGIMTVYDDAGGILLQAQLYEDAAGMQTYRGQGSERREKLT